MAKRYEEILGTEFSTSWSTFAEALKTPALAVGIEQQIERNELERRLEIPAIRQHLDHIYQHPRRTLRSKEEVLAAPRVKRLSTRAILDLTSRSERWRRRTLRGIEPREVLALVQEDIVDRYENRLAADFSDRVIALLDERLEQLHSTDDLFKLIEKFQKSAEDSDKVWYRLRARLYRLWGQSADQLIETRRRLNEVQAALERLRDRFVSYRSLPLYAEIPSAHRVPDSIHETNILQNDQHYCSLPPLWRQMLLGRRTRSKRNALQESKKGQYDTQLFQRFVKGLLARALASLGFFLANRDEHERQWVLNREKRGPSLQVMFGNCPSISLQADGFKETLTFRAIPVAGLNTDAVLRAEFVAWFHEQEAVQSPPVVFLVSGDSSVKEPPFLHKSDGGRSRAVSISPMDLWSVERVGRIIREWLDGYLLKSFPIKMKNVGRVFADSIPENASVKWDETTKAFLVWNRLPPIDQWKPKGPARMHQRHDLTSLREAVEAAQQEVDALLTCPICGGAGNFGGDPDHRNQTYIARCDDPGCNAEWGLAGLNRMPFVRVGSGALQSMKNAGMDGLGNSED